MFNQEVMAAVAEHHESTASQLRLILVTLQQHSSVLAEILNAVTTDAGLKNLADLLKASSDELAATLERQSNLTPNVKGMSMANGTTGNPVLDNLIAQVEAAIGVEQSAVTFVNGVPAMITAAVNKAISGGATAAQLAPLTDLAMQLAAASGPLQAALAANAPPASPPATGTPTATPTGTPASSPTP